MVNTEKQSFWNMMNVCCELYKRPVLSKEAVSIWWSKLEKFEFHVVSKAFDKWSDDSSHMPTPHDIIELCKTQQDRVFHQKITKKLSDEELQANRDRIKDIIDSLGKRIIMQHAE
jgi:hypothetical protein